MRHPLIELTRARVLAFVREPGALFWVFVFPLLLAAALGAAFRSKPPESVKAGIVSESAGARWGAEVLSRAEAVDAVLVTGDEAREALRKGKIDVVVSIGGIGGIGDIGTSIEYRFDPTKPQASGARLTVDDVLQRALGRADPAVVTQEELTEPGSRYIDFLLPGLIGLNLMGSSMWGLGFALVMARVRKILKRLSATPMRRPHYLLAMMLARLVYLAMELGALLLFGRLLFGVSVAGSLLDVFLVAAVGAATFAGLALLVGARATAIESASGLMNFVMLPMWVMSGSFFSYSRFPDALQPVIRLLPLTALNDALRAVMNDGASILATTPQLAVLAGWGLLSFAVALKIFRWQ